MIVERIFPQSAAQTTEVTDFFLYFNSNDGKIQL
jgi:hypothetical protein